MLPSGRKGRDLGADHYERHTNTNAKKRHHIRQLQALG